MASAIQQAKDLYNNFITSTKKTFTPQTGTLARGAQNFFNQPLPTKQIQSYLNRPISQPLQKVGSVMNTVNKTVSNTPILGTIANAPQSSGNFASQSILRGQQQINQPGVMNKAKGVFNIGMGALSLTPGAQLPNLSTNLAQNELSRVPGVNKTFIPGAAGLVAGFASPAGVEDIANLSKTLGKGKIIAKGFDWGRTSRMKWDARDVGVLEKVNELVNKKLPKTLSDENLAKRTQDLKVAGQWIDDLARGYLPKETVTTLAEKYGKNSRSYLKAVVNELHKSAQNAPSSNWQDALTMGIRDKIKLQGMSQNNTDNLLNEAKKYKSAEEFVKAHQANSLLDLSNFKQHRIGRIFDEAGGEGIQNTFDIVKEYKNIVPEEIRKGNVPLVNSPDDLVTIYRGTVKAQRRLEAGDFVSFSKKYALSHNNGEKLLTLKVPAKDVIWQGNDLSEWVYSPENIRKQFPNGLVDIWNQAQKQQSNLSQLQDLGMGIQGQTPKQQLKEFMQQPTKLKQMGMTNKQIDTTSFQEGQKILGQGMKSAGEVIGDTQSYLKELVDKQNSARDVSGFKSVPGKVGNFLNEVKRKIVDSTAPIEDALSSAEKTHKFSVLPKDDIRLQIDRVLRSKTLASKFAEDNGLVNVIKQAPDLNALDQYMIAKQARAVAQNGIETGRNLQRDAQLITDLSATYEPLAQQVNQYSRKLLQYSVDNGLIDSKLAEDLIKKYPEYVPLNRVFNELEKQTLPRVGTKAVASLSRQSVVQKLQGSEREIASPIESLLLKTQDAFNQGERNKAAQMLTSYQQLPGNPFQLTPLRTAENVQKRINILTDLKGIFKEKRNYLGKLKTANRGIRSIERKQSRSERLLEVLADKAATMSSEFEAPSKVTQVLDKALTIEKKIFKLEAELQAGKTTKAREELQTLIGQRNVVVKLLREELKNVRDINKTPDQETISVLRNGIKETWVTSKEVAAAAKSLNVEQMGLLGKIFSVPTRVLQLGATGLNVPFVATNVLKDQITGFVNSNRAAKTSLLNPVNFAKSLFEAFNHGDLYDELVRSAGGGTKFDISREAPSLSVKQLRASKNLASKIKYTATNPGELLRAVENFIGKGEEVSRIQNFKGTRDALIKEGRTVQDATLLAAKAARENTANFARKGEWSKVLNATIPFFNAGIQGARQLVRSFQNDPKGTAFKVSAGLFLPTATITAWNLSDPKRKQIYQDLPEYEKENNLIIIPDGATQNSKGKWNVIKIPIPPGLSNLASLIRRPLEQANGLDPVRFGEIASNLITAGSSIDVSSPNKLASSLVPQGAKPIVEGITNTNLFTGQKIVPDYMKDLPAAQQVKPDTSPVAKAVGQATGISPLQIENAASTIGGGVGSQLTGKESIIGNLQRRFTQASGGAITDKIYNEANQYEAIISQAKSAAKNGDVERAKQLITQNKQILAKGSIASKYKTYLSKIYTARQKVLANPQLSQEQKNQILMKLQTVTTKLSQSYLQIQKGGE